MIDLQEMANRSARNFNFWYKEATRELKTREMERINELRIASDNKLYERHFLKYRHIRECEAVIEEKKAKKRIKK